MSPQELIDTLVSLYKNRRDDELISIGHWHVPGFRHPELPDFYPDVGISVRELRGMALPTKNTADEISRFRTIISALVEWRDKPWTPKWIDMRGLPSWQPSWSNPKGDLYQEIEQARSETEQVWQAAREAIKADQPK